MQSQKKVVIKSIRNHDKSYIALVYLMSFACGLFNYVLVITKISIKREKVEQDLQVVKKEVTKWAPV